MCRPVTGSCPTVSGAATWPPLAEADSEYVFTPNELVPTVVPNPHPQVSASGDDAPVVAPAPPGHQRSHQGQRLAMRRAGRPLKGSPNSWGATRHNYRCDLRGRHRLGHADLDGQERGRHAGVAD